MHQNPRNRIVLPENARTRFMAPAWGQETPTSRSDPVSSSPSVAPEVVDEGRLVESPHEQLFRAEHICD
jgi:hypothetical protein